MAYKYKDKELKVGSSWTDDNGFIHPYNWADTWSSDDLAKWGVTYSADPDKNFDRRFYISKDVAKSLTDITNEDKTVTPGLKSIYIEETKKTANSKLAASDWYVTRKADIGEAIPSKIDTYRKAVRTAASNIETKINNCSDISSLEKLFDVPLDSNNRSIGNAPINDWPDEVS